MEKVGKKDSHGMKIFKEFRKVWGGGREIKKEKRGGGG